MRGGRYRAGVSMGVVVVGLLVVNVAAAPVASGEIVAFSRNNGTFVMGPDGSNQRQLSDMAFPTWAPGGGRLVVGAFGAAFYGSAGALRLEQPITAIAVTSTGRGYWLAAADGGLFTYGDAPYFGSIARPIGERIVAIAGHH